MTANPAHNPDEYSRQLIQNEIRPGIQSYLDDNFDDPESGQRGADIPDEPGTYPPLVVTALPGGGRVLYPHVVVQEQGDNAAAADQSNELTQHDFAVSVGIHGRTTTEMFNLRGLVRGWFIRNQNELGGNGFAEPELSGNPADWDRESRTNSWSLTVTGLVYTHPDSTTDLS